MRSSKPSAGILKTAAVTGGSAPKSAVSDAVAAFEAAIAQAVAALTAALPVEQPRKGRRGRKINALRRQAIPLLSEMLRDAPSLSGDFTADAIDAAMADASVCALLSDSLTNVQAAVDHAATVRVAAAWDMANEVYAVARKRSARSASLHRALADVKAILAQGKRADTAPGAAVTAQLQADRALARAAKADAKAKAKAARAAALNPPASDAVATEGTPANTPRTEPGSSTPR